MFVYKVVVWSYLRISMDSMFLTLPPIHRWVVIIHNVLAAVVFFFSAFLCSGKLCQSALVVDHLQVLNVLSGVSGAP